MIASVQRNLSGMLGRLGRPARAGDAIPIFHMNSFSRSGETLMLRTLNAHPRIRVVHQIVKPDARKDCRLFDVLREHRDPTIDSSHPAARHCGLTGDQILVVKNAVWEHAAPWRGFILIRNPLSVMYSARVHSEHPVSKSRHEDQVIRWARGIDERMLPYLRNVDNLTGFCLLYARKMTLAHASGMPIVQYERFVADPETTLAKILGHFGLEWDERVMRAHEDYPEGQIGHGGFKLWRPIHRESLHSYQELPDDVVDRIYALTAPVCKLYGYEYRNRELRLSDDFDDRFSRIPSPGKASGGEP